MKSIILSHLAVCAAMVGFGSVTQQGATQTQTDRGVAYTWTANGSVVIPEGGRLVDLLLVGGGGGGGANNGGGGGGGGFVESMSVSLPAGTYSVEIGQGGAGSTSGRGSNGGDTVIKNALGEVVYVAHGGGGGGPGNKSTTPGADGASGGGSTYQASTKAGGSSIYSGEGFAGGYVVKADTDDICSGGGGGAGGPGEDAYALVQRKAKGNGHSGHGGPGRLSLITGQYYGGGGGAGIYHDANDQWGGEVKALSGMGGKGGGGHGVRLVSGNVDERYLEDIEWYAGKYNYTAEDFATRYEVGDGVSDRFNGVNGLGGGGGGAGRGTGASVVGNGGSGVVVLHVLGENSIEVTHDDTSFTVKCFVLDLQGADAVDILLAFAPSGSALPALEMRKSGAVMEEIVDVVVDGLTTGETYAYKVVYRKAGTLDEIFAKEGTVLVHPAVVPLETAVWVSGLKQAKFNSSYDKASGLADSKINVEVVPGPVMADLKINNDGEASSKGWTNPYTRTVYNYNGQNTTFAYIGYIWLDAGVQYNFAKNIDDSGYIKIGDTVVIDDGGYQSYPVKNFMSEESGWFAVDMRCGDGSGGKGPSAGGIGSAMGFGYNKAGVTTQQSTGWNLVRDQNDGLFLRTEDPQIASMMSISSLKKSGGDVVFFASFMDVPAAAELRAYYDVKDNGDTPSQWDNYVKVADIQPGATEIARYVATGAANGYVRIALVVAGTDAVQGRYQFAGATVFSGENPIVSTVLESVGYTNVAVSVTMAAMGGDATSATTKVLVSTSEDMSNAREITLNPMFTELGTRQVQIDGLQTNMTYYVCVSAVNNAGYTATSSVKSFLTLTPTTSQGSFLLKSNASTSQTFFATVTDLGDDSSSATITMQCATDANFTAGLCESDPLDVVESDVNVAKELSVSGLQKNTPYYSRLKIVNTWGFVYYAESFFCPTFDSLVVQGVGYTAVEGGFDVDVVVSYMDGSGATVELFANGASVGTKMLTEAGTASFEVASAADLTSLRAVVTGFVEVEKKISAKKGTSAVVVGDSAEHASAATAVKLHVGDSIMLPVLIGNMSYKVLNQSFLSIEDNVLTAIKPGIVGVECYDVGGLLATTMAVLVLPDKIANGSIYIWNEKGSGGENWCSAASWLNVDGTAATDFPKHVDDIAIIPHYDTNGKWLKLNQDISLGGLIAGRFNSVNADANVHITRSVATTPTLTFERSDGEPVVIQICGNAVGYEKRYVLYFADGNDKVNFIYASDTIVDCGWDGLDSKYAGGRPNYADNCTNEIPAGVTLVWQNIDTTGQNMGTTFSPPIFAGSGTVWNRSGADIRYDRASPDFTGVIRDSGHGNKDANRSAPTYFNSYAMTNASAEAVGFVAVSSGAPSASTAGAGMILTGWDGWANPEPPYHDSYLPRRGLSLVNGLFVCGATQSGSWGVGVAEKRLTDVLAVRQGFSYISRNSNRNNKDGNPINWFEADALVHENKGTIRIDDYNRSEYGSPQTTTNNVTVLHGVANHLVGGTGDPLASENYPIVPWMVTPSNHTDYKKLAFACVDGEERICDMSVRTSRALDAVVDEYENAFVKDKSIKLTANRTVNSLWLNNPNQGNGSKNLGSAENTLTVSSGGVILNSSSSGIGTQDRPSENGKLVLGDATHPGYVFAESSDASKPNGIWAEVTAPGGLVFGYTGYALLAGDQTGVDDELVVNAGTLDLGSQDKTVACTLDVPVRILANATVKMNNAEMSNSAVYFDDIAGYSGKIQLNANTTCKRLYVRDTPEEAEWTSMRSGTYGASGSCAANIDDAHFAGTGVLTVCMDDMFGLQIFIR